MALNILCLDDDEGVLISIRSILNAHSHYHIKTTKTWEQASLVLETESIDVMLLDVNLGKGKETGLDLLPRIKHKYPDMDVMIVTGERDGALFKQALTNGATDYYSKPIQSDLALSIQKLEFRRETEKRCEALYGEVSKQYIHGHKEFVGHSPAFLKVLEKAARLKGTAASVLIEAETGAGKELLAKYIYGLEEAPKRPFIVVNCATLPENLIESELFGHEKGSFTGAIRRQIGKFQLADGGDIFLDEINSLRLDLQAKLLRVIQEKMVYPVGSKEPVKADCRVIAATNENLKKLCAAGSFREDLYHRLNVIKLILPPLRERTEDIPLLIDYFIRKYDTPARGKKISAVAMRYLLNYSWPGNIRELENQICSMVLLSRGKVMNVDDLPEHILVKGAPEAVTNTLKFLEKVIGGEADLFQLRIEDFTKVMRYEYVKRTIERNDGCVTDAAQKMGVGRTWLYKVIREARTIKRGDNGR